jgi:PST family polysaccharide transporter
MPFSDRFSESKVFRRVLSSLSWLVVDKILRMLVGIIVNALIARHLGVSEFGIWSFCIAYSGLFVAISNLGLDDIIVRDIVIDKANIGKILGTAFVLKALAGIFTVVISLIIINILKDGDEIFVLLVLLTTFSYVFQSFDVIKFHFRAKIISKYIVLSSTFSFFIVTVIRAYLLYIDADILSFAFVSFIEFVITAALYVYFYLKLKFDIRKWRYDKLIAKKMLKDGFPLILAGIAVMVMLRIDQVMIGEMAGNKEVGEYSAAVRISEMVFFIIPIIIGTVFPVLITAKERSLVVFETRLKELVRALLGVSLLIAISIYSFKKEIIDIVFGDEFKEAASILGVHVWAGVLMSLCLLSNSWLVSSNLQKYIFYRNIVGVVINIALNYFLIGLYGGIGAAVATIIALIYVAIIADLLSKVTRPMFIFKMRSIFFINK